ncbi:NUDIX domain-containing protein [Homoserinimonas sp. A520]
MTTLEDQPFAAPVLSSEAAFEGKVWNVKRERFEYGTDEYGAGELVREFVDHPGAVAVLAVDDQDRVLLIRQYRHPIGMRDLELPAGLLDIHGESLLVAAQRELAEEVDLEASEWALLTEFYTSPGGSSEAITVYLARGLSATPTFARHSEEADIELHWVSLDEAVEAVLDRRIGNAITCIALLTAHAMRGRGWVGLGNADSSGVGPDGSIDAPWPRHPKLRD